MADTTIEWTQKVWNPVTGCTKVSQGCKNCYAEREWIRKTANPKLPKYFGRAFTDVKCHEDVLDAPLHWRKPCRVFVNSMSDLFHEAVPFEFIRRIWDVAGQRLDHTFQILTKRPQRMIEFARWMAGDDDVSIAEWPRNCWLGVSVEDQKTADERIPLLLQVPAAIRWISAEPLLGPIHLGRWEDRGRVTNSCSSLLDGLNWVVVGGESGPVARPMHPDWARSLRDQCQAAGVPFFFKQWGEWEPSVDFPKQFEGISATTPCMMLAADGHTGHSGEEMQGHPRAGLMVKTGKKRAGRLLFGREHSEYPEVRA